MRKYYKSGGKEKAPSRLKIAGVSGYDKPKGTPNHPRKSHIVVAKETDQVKAIRFGEQGAKTAGNPKSGESDRAVLMMVQLNTIGDNSPIPFVQNSFYSGTAEYIVWSWLER